MPFAATDPLDGTDVAIALPENRLRAQQSIPFGGNDDLAWATTRVGGDCPVDAFCVVRAVCRYRRQRILDLLEQRRDAGAIPNRLAAELRRDDVAGLGVDRYMQLAPDTMQAGRRGSVRSAAA